MSLQPQTIDPVPALTAQIAHAAFANGNPYLLLRDKLGTIYTDALFADLFLSRGQPALAPWQLALVTLSSSPKTSLADKLPIRFVSERRPAVLTGSICWDWS